MKISVIIPARNASRTIGRTLASVFAQTRLPDEVVVVDDGSADDSPAILAEYQNRVVGLRIPPSGAAAARNAGARIACGELLFFCDADLALYPALLQKLEAALLADSGAAFAYCSFEWHGKIFEAKPFNPEKLRQINYISTMSLVRASAFPGFDESLPRFQDWDLWLTVVERGGRGVPVPEVLFRVLEAGTMSRRGGLSRLFATRRVRAKHHLAWGTRDFWLAFKESVKARRI